MHHVTLTDIVLVVNGSDFDVISHVQVETGDIFSVHVVTGQDGCPLSFIRPVRYLENLYVVTVYEVTTWWLQGIEQRSATELLYAILRSGKRLLPLSTKISASYISEICETSSCEISSSAPI